MARCQETNRADSNCAEKLGPDYDFGGSSAILQTVNGRDILLAAGKGGVAIALDPENEGKLQWRTQLWEDQAPSASGLVVWGGAADGSHVYYPLQQAGGGLKALDIKTGKVDWNAAINATSAARRVRRVIPESSSRAVGTESCVPWMPVEK
jgi:polyvinyl alcohol dehydrogenase (cytochrome)